MMTKGQDSPSEMAHARQSEGINVIFDQDTLPGSSSIRSRSRSSGGSSRSSGSDRRPRGSNRRRYRSSSASSTSSSSSSRSPPRSRSRSHPRCHRGSSRCCCHRNGYGRRHHSSPLRYRARSRSYSRSPSPDRSLSHRSYRSRSRSPSHWNTRRRGVGRFRASFSRSPSRTLRSRSSSKSSGCSAVSLGVDEKRELLRAAKANAIKILGVEQLELPESVKPLLGEQPAEIKQATPEPEARVRPEPVSQKTPSQSSEAEADEDMPSPKMSPSRKLISFSIHNSVAKPTVAAPPCAKVTPRVDSYESRKPYGHWVPVKNHRASRKHTLTKSR